MSQIEDVENEIIFREWEMQRRQYIILYGFSVFLLVCIIAMVIAPSQAQVPVAQEQEVLVLVTQLRKIQPDTQVLEIELPETQLREIRPEILEIRMPVTKWLSRQEPQVLILKPETQILEIKVPVTQWLKGHVPEMQVLEIQVPVALLQEIRSETQWLGIQMTVAQLQEIQGTEGLVFVAQVPKDEILSNWIFWVTIGYLVFYILYQQFFVKRRKNWLSRKACIFMAKTSADSLEQGNKVRASLSMDRLLSTLSDFLRQKLVSLIEIRVAPQNFIHVAPEKIPRKAVFQAIQASEDTKVFQERLRDLAIGLGGNMDEGYLSASNFLVWLDKETEPYQKTYSKSFFEKYPTMKTVLTYLGPIIVALVAVATLIIQTLS